MNTEKQKILYNAVVVFLLVGDNVWLGLKTKKIGKDCLNGPGGGIEKDESYIDAAQRETEEETGLKISRERFKYVGISYMHNVTVDSEFDCDIAIFTVEVTSTEIPIPQYSKKNPEETPAMIDFNLYKRATLPITKLMLADQRWIPHIFGNDKFKVKGTYGPFQKTLIGEVTVEFVDELPER